MPRFFTACGGRQPIRIELRPAGATAPITAGFDKPFLLVGSDPQCDLCVPGAAPAQLLFHLIEGRVFAVALTADPPTRVGGEPLQAGWVLPRYEFDLGPAVLRVPNPKQPGVGPRPDVNPLAATAGSMPLYELHVTAPNGVLQRAAVARRLLLLGRTFPSRLRIHHDSLAAVHVGLLTTPAGVWAVDLTGQSGVSAGGRRGAAVPVPVGAEFRLQDVPFDFRLMPPSQVPIPAEVITPPPPRPGLRPPPAALIPAPHPNTEAIIRQMADFQERSLDQFKQVLAGVMQMVGGVVQEQRLLMKDELDRMERALRPAVGPPHPLPLPPANGHPPPPALPAAPAPAPPPGTNEALMHGWLADQMHQMETAQKGMWKRLFGGRGGGEPGKS